MIEEAAEVLEAHIITSLSRDVKHLILIGDHYQLRPSPAYYELDKNYNLGISLFERLINNGLHHACLELQHRMRPEISRPLMPHFYANLRDHDSVQNYESVRGVTSNVVFITHDHPEDGDNPDSTTHRNTHESEFVVALALYFLQQGYSPSQITILTPYLGQLFDIMKLIKSRAEHEGICAALLKEVKVTAVDNYQGEENDIIIMSMVRSIPKGHGQFGNKKTTIGFLARKNRVCVALSRAKLGLFVFGNFKLFSSKTMFWSNICDSLTQHGLLRDAVSIECVSHGRIVPVRTAEELRAAAPDGGCQVPCVARLVCGHACKRLCHPQDPQHIQIKCNERCPRLCTSAPSGVTPHECRSICSSCWAPTTADNAVGDFVNACKPCERLVDRNLDRCGHLVKDVPCGKNQSAIECQQPCETMLPCGHQCVKCCHSDSVVHTEHCGVRVTKLRSCGHNVRVPCHQNPNTSPCTVKVTKSWPGCEHEVENVDCSTDVNATVCPAPCTAQLQCEHVCTGSCDACLNGRLHIRCRQKCGRLLICGHVCPETCCTPCPPCRRPCETKCEHSLCSTPSSERQCGVPCSSCSEKCSWACEHLQCDLHCSVPCERPKCNEPCRVTLPDCDHPCMGLCGEPCPKICRRCQPDSFKERLDLDFYTNEDDDDARFYTLPDCGHTMEVEMLDHWIETRMAPSANDGEGSEISLLVCPACKQPIRTAKRYSKEMKQNSKVLNAVKCAIMRQGTETVPLTIDYDPRDPTEAIRQKFRLERNRLTALWTTIEGCVHKYSEEAMNLCAAITAYLASVPNSYTAVTYHALIQTSNLITCLSGIAELDAATDKFDSSIASVQQRSTTAMRQLTNVWKACRPLSQDARELHADVIREDTPTSIKSWIQCHIGMMRLETTQCTAWLAKTTVTKTKSKRRGGAKEKLHLHPLAMTEQMLTEFSLEIHRVKCLIGLLQTIAQLSLLEAELPVENVDVARELLTSLMYLKKPFGDEDKKSFMEKLETLKKINPLLKFNISEEERTDILRAMQFGQRGHWYQCPNGHIYSIGNCGGATMESKCPECKEVIGGTQHRLNSTNRVATIMDGASAPAWPPRQ